MSNVTVAPTSAPDSSSSSSSLQNIFGYDPNKHAAEAAAILFAALCIITFALNIKFKSRFLMVIPIAALMETIGYALRPYSAFNVGKYIITTLCILLAPTIFAMADYALISKIMIKTGVHHPIFTPKRVRWMFLWADVTSFLIQIAGGGLTASTNIQTSLMGSKLLIAGLSIALCVFVFFLFMLIYIYFKMRDNLNDDLRNCKIMMYVLFFDMILLILRSAYRVAEYGDLKYHNSVSTNEHLFYGCDFTEMLLLNLIWVPFHPGFWNILEIPDETNPTISDQKRMEMGYTK